MMSNRENYVLLCYTLGEQQKQIKSRVDPILKSLEQPYIVY